jgi:glucoamylase
MEPLEPWIARQYRHSASAMMRSVSPTGIVKTRPGFGQIIRPLAGAIVASPELAAYDPEPDYFFHWHRDSAIVIDAVRLAAGDAALGIDARRHIEDFVRFSRSLQQLDGRVLVAQPAWRERIATGFHSFVRPDSELADLFGTAVDADTRFNPDGSIDISRWGRPQMDGPALRALALLRWSSHSSVPRLGAGSEFGELLQSDLAFVQHRWREASFDIWEEEKGQHYYTLRVAAAALDEGSAWLRQAGETHAAEHCTAEATQILRTLDGYWSEEHGHYRSRILESGAVTSKELDIAVVLAAVHSGSDAPLHSVRDPKMHRTLARLEALFAAAYPINQQRPAHHGVAMGRYADDVYYSGGAYFFSTLGAAEFCYRAAPAADSAANGRRWRERGDAFLNTVRRFTPDTGDLSEQFDQRTGEPRSARNLAWSYAAFISCIDARRRAQDTGLGSTS